MHGSARLLLVPTSLLLLAGPGCSRNFFRERADADVAGVITQKNYFPAWAVKNWFVYPHPDSRFADPYNPDRPPYPPDDYAARLLSPNPQHPTRKTGTGRYDGEGYMRLLAEWDAQNRSEDPALAAGARGASPGSNVILAGGRQPPERLPDLPQPAGPKQPADPKAATPPGQFPSVESLAQLGTRDDDYLRALDSNQQGFRLRFEQAVDLGLVNSREFQDRREDLYLAALPVTLERYNFAAQAFFIEQATRNFTGSELGGAGRLWRLETSTGFSKNLATGGQLLMRAANDVVLNLGAGKPNVAVSNLSLTFVQPFLRGGGFAVTLEGLTVTERNMVYAMRSYARFRKLYYVSLAAGQSGGNITNNPYGLQGLSVNLGRGIGGNLTAPSVGFLPLLQQAAVIANQRRNVAFLERLLDLYKALREGGDQSDLQVGQVEVQLLNSRGQLLGSAGGGGASGIRGYIDQLDNFKLQLGLPMTVGLDLDETQLKPIRDQLARFEDLYADRLVLATQAQQYNPNNPIAQFRPHWRRLLTESELVKGTAFARGIIARWDAWAKLTAAQLKARLDELARERQKLLNEKTDWESKNLPVPPALLQRLDDNRAELELGVFEQAVRMHEAKPSPEGFQNAAAAFVSVALGALNERVIETRKLWPKLPGLPVNGVDILGTDLDTAYTAGIQVALSDRLDLMNARGQVVDAYRQIAVQANSLQGVLNVRYDATTTTPAGESRPFAFSPERSNQQLVFSGELPLVRRAERNNYRASLISYQRQRRTLMAFEDNIANDVRSDIRQLRTLAQLYRIQQRVVELAYPQVDNAYELLNQPPAPGGAGTSAAANAAALTTQVLQNQSNLLNAQNNLYNLWVSYLTARMKLYLDLELMQLDDRGVWCDEPTTGSDNPPATGSGPHPERLPAPQPMGPADRK